MPIATMTTKGQITIPKEIREFLRLKPGDRLDFIKEPDGEVRLRAATRDIMELAGFLKWDGPSVSVEEMNDAIRRAVVERYKRSIR